MRAAPHQNQVAAAGKPADAARLLGRSAARVAMIRAGVDRGELARRLGITPKAVTDIFARNFPGNYGFRLEAALGYAFPIFTSPRDLRQRRRCLEALGFDPFTISRPELKVRVRALGLTVRRDDSLDHLRQLVLRHLAANPKQFSAPSTPSTTP